MRDWGSQGRKLIIFARLAGSVSGSYAERLRRRAENFLSEAVRVRDPDLAMFMVEQGPGSTSRACTSSSSAPSSGATGSGSCCPR